MSEEHPEGTGRERLENSTTIGEVLEVAMGFEATARDFYASLAGRVSKPLRGLVQELAEEEKRHYQLFSDLRERPDVQEKYQKRSNAPPTTIASPTTSSYPSWATTPTTNRSSNTPWGGNTQPWSSTAHWPNKRRPGRFKTCFVSWPLRKWNTRGNWRNAGTSWFIPVMSDAVLHQSKPSTRLYPGPEPADRLRHPPGPSSFLTHSKTACLAEVPDVHSR